MFVMDLRLKHAHPHTKKPISILMKTLQTDNSKRFYCRWKMWCYSLSFSYY